MKPARSAIAQKLRHLADALDPASRSIQPAIDVCQEMETALSVEGWSQPTAREWVECRLTIGGSKRSGQLPKRLLDLVTNGLDNGLFQDFFFMSKPPGLRVRFHAGPAGICQLTKCLRKEMARLQHDTLIGAWNFAVYEPETHLFGGKTAMTGVHRLFTADSVAWLRHHACSTSSTSPWIVSLNMLHALFEAMDIIGWEDLAVWEHCRRSANRRLESPPSDAFTASATKIASLWSHPDRLGSLLDAPARQLVADFAQSVSEVCEQWIPHCFHSEHARVGPREAAAFLTVYHWNRAGLEFARQILITEALADRSRLARN